MKKIKNNLNKAKYLIPILLLSLTLILCFNTVSAGTPTTVYVNNATGNNSWDGMNPTWNGTSGPKASIQNGTDTVASGGTVNVADGVYKEHLNINKNVNLTGQSQTGTIIDGTNNGTVITISGLIVNIAYFTIQNGNSTNGGGILNSGGICTVTNCTIQNNNATNGGGIYFIGTCTVTNSTIQNNTAPWGGAIFNNQGICTVTNSTIQNNTARYGGGIINFAGNCTFTNVNIIHNIANVEGGGIENQGNCTLIDCTIQNNSAIMGGVIYNYANYGNCTIINSNIIQNTAGAGGVIYNYGNSTVINSNIINNTAQWGGAIYNSGNCTVTNSNIIQNIADGRGGGIYNDGAFTAHFNRIYNNTATTGSAICSNGVPANATNNWWGSNTDPTTITNLIVGMNDARIYADPWLIMTFNAYPTTINPGETSTLTASFNINSDGNPVGGPVNHIPDGIPVIFTTDSGKVYTAASGVVNSKSVVAYTVNGVATAILDGDALVTANLDNQTLNTTVTFNSANAASQTTSTGKTIGMQNTGLPIAGLILAILALFGGIVIPKRK